MLVDPNTPMLKAPGTTRLKLKYYEMLTSFAFNFNLRRYTKSAAALGEAMSRVEPARYCSTRHRWLFNSQHESESSNACR